MTIETKTTDRWEAARACDRWDRVEDNLYAIGKHIEAVRAQGRYGVGSVDRAFEGYLALPGRPGWWQILGVPRTASAAEIAQAFERAAFKAHPDRGGSADEMARINIARAEAYKERGAPI